VGGGGGSHEGSVLGMIIVEKRKKWQRGMGEGGRIQRE
jgi:hypothetical protein